MWTSLPGRATVACHADRSPPCEAVAKLRRSNRFRVVKLVTGEVEEVRYYCHSSACEKIIRKKWKDQQLNRASDKNNWVDLCFRFHLVSDFFYLGVYKVLKPHHIFPVMV